MVSYFITVTKNVPLFCYIYHFNHTDHPILSIVAYSIRRFLSPGTNNTTDLDRNLVEVICEWLIKRWIHSTSSFLFRTTSWRNSEDITLRGWSLRNSSQTICKQLHCIIVKRNWVYFLNRSRFVLMEEYRSMKKNKKE